MKQALLKSGMFFVLLAGSAFPAAVWSAAAPLASSASGQVRLSPEEQQQKAIEKFHQIYNLARAENRSDNLDQMGALYRQIIHECPDVPLAQESYWRLIELLLRDVQPPRPEEALGLFKEFLATYPDSPLAGAVQETAMRMFFLGGSWQELSAACEQIVAKRPGADAPMPLYYCAETRLHFGDRAAAAQEFAAVAERFPESRPAAMAKERLAELEQKGAAAQESGAESPK